MRISSFFNTAVALVTAVAFSSCASIFSGSNKKVTFDSIPPNAQVTIQDKRGVQVTSFETPGVATLQRGDGFFRPAQYTATIHKKGYQTATVHISHTMNPWYFGNLLIGGIIGFVIVDPATGAMYTLTPEKISTALVPAKG